MNILGINYYYHDTTASIVQDGQLMMAIEEERLTRDKHTWLFPHSSIKKVMDSCQLTPEDIDHIAVSIKPTLNMWPRIVYGLKNIVNVKPFLKHELIGGRNKQKMFWEWYNITYKNISKKPQIHFVPHHLCHAIGTYNVSPYKEAAILSIDGAGEWSTSMLGFASGDHHYEIYNESFFPFSLGSFYESITQFCGFKPNYDEGKTMGLAPMGNPDVFYDKMKSLVKVDSQGGILIDLSYFNYQFWGHQRFSDKFIKVFGKPRTGRDFEEHHLNVAAAGQKVLEDVILEMSDILYEKTRTDYLVISGGVALNSVDNGRIVRESKFKDVYVMPAAGDNGSGIGASYYVYNNILGHKRNFVHLNPYVGTEYTNKEIECLINECKLNAEYHKDICSKAAQLLHDGNILGWFQGKMEIGPRSLGNRSILADPTRPEMKDKINAEVKHREAYRPFAPSCTVEAKDEFFDIGVEAPFMLKVCFVKPQHTRTLPAITHVDESARLQTVRKEVNPLYHELLTKFGELSGAAVLLNTSFNIMGEPIVESPIQAIRCFFSTGLDVLVLGNYLIKK